MSAIVTTADAERAIDELSALIDKLAALMEQETALVHSGKISHAADLGQAKAALAHQLYAGGERLKANAKFVLQAVPAHCAALQRAQEMFRVTLQKNMIVLATTHAVAEGIVRRLSGDLAKKSAPQVYGATGRATAPHPKHGQPLAISKKL
jgi:flagellar biosynthesis/type III secretory pathway chaperone